MKINLKKITYLNGSDVISAQVSDHHPVLRNGVLFWNVMMQGRKRISSSGDSYNNGFGIVETDAQYKIRLQHVANVIGEIVETNPNIYAIGLCEGPIQKDHVDSFVKVLEQHNGLKRFLDKSLESFQRPIIDKTPNWGLMMFIDHRYQAIEMKQTTIEKLPVATKLLNRFKTWQLKSNEGIKYISLAHFPFGGDEHIVDQNKLSTHGNIYRKFINHLLDKNANEEYVLCADFNFNPHLLSQRDDRVLDEVANNNSIVMTNSTEKINEVTSVTVDGILFSNKSKQIFASTLTKTGLFSRLKLEDKLAQSMLDYQASINATL